MEDRAVVAQPEGARGSSACCGQKVGKYALSRRGSRPCFRSLPKHPKAQMGTSDELETCLGMDHRPQAVPHKHEVISECETKILFLLLRSSIL